MTRALLCLCLFACGGIDDPDDPPPPSEPPAIGRLCDPLPAHPTFCYQAIWEYGGKALCEVSGCDFYADWCPDGVAGSGDCKPVRIACVTSCEGS